MDKRVKPYQLIWLAAVLLVLFMAILPPVFGIGGGAQFEVMTHVGLFSPNGDASVISGSYGIMEGTGAQGFYETCLSALVSLCRGAGTFPIQLLGGIYAVIFLAALYVLLKYLQGARLWVNIAASALVVLVFCDLGYVAYFNSFYQDALSFVLLFAIAAVVLSMRYEMKWWKLALFTVLAAAFVFTRKLNGIIGLGLVFAAIWMARLPELGRLKLASWLCAAVIAVSCGASFFTTLIPAEQESKFNSVFYGALKDSKNPQADAAALGLREQDAGLAGRTYYDEAVAVPDLTNLTYGDITAFYFTHPSALMRELKIAANNSYFLTQGYLNYGGGGWKHRLALKIWSFLKRTVIPQGLWVILIFCAVYLGLCMVNARKYHAAGEEKSCFLAGTLAILPVAALIELVGTVILTGEAAISRNLFCFGIYFDLMLVSALIWAAHTILDRRHVMKTKYGVNQ